MLYLYIDGKRTERICIQLQAGQRGEDEILGIQKSATSVLPFKFQELQLVGALPQLIPTCPFLTFAHLLPKIQTYLKLPPSCPKWEWLKFESFVSASGARENNGRLVQSMARDCIKDRYQSATSRQGGIMLGTPRKPPVQFSSISDPH